MPKQIIDDSDRNTSLKKRKLTMLKDTKIIGVIYPLPKQLVDRINDQRNIFVKFLTHEPSKKSLKIEEGNKLFIYQSRDKKMIVAFAFISKIEYLYIEEIFHQYKNQTIASFAELKDYAKGRERRKLLVLHINSFKRFEKQIEVREPITMTGKYVTNENIEELFGKMINIGE